MLRGKIRERHDKSRMETLDISAMYMVKPRLEDESTFWQLRASTTS